jgi:hypothetical protein
MTIADLFAQRFEKTAPGNRIDLGPAPVVRELDDDKAMFTARFRAGTAERLCADAFAFAAPAARLPAGSLKF